MVDKAKANSAHSRGKLHLNKKRPLQAMIAFTEAIKFDDSHYESYMGRAEAYLQLEYHYVSRVDAQKCIDLKPKSVEGYLLKGKIEYTTEAFKEARETYEKGLDVDSMNAELLSALQKTNQAERSLMFREKQLQMQGTGVGSFIGVIFLLVNELLLNPQVIQGIVMKGIIFGACAYLGYAATKFYTDLLEQQRKILLEPPKEVTSDPFAGMSNPSPDETNNSTESKKVR